MTRILRTLLLLGLGAPRLAAQTTGVVYGTVTDTAGHPVPYAQIRVGPSLGTTASQTGGFRFAGIAPGAAAITVRAPGYQAETDTVAVAAGDSVRLAIRLQPSRAIDLEPVIVTASKRSQLLAEAVTSVAVVSGTELRNRAVSTVDEAVNKAAGVLFLNGQVNIRGSSGFVEGLGSRVLLLVDGVPANEGDRGGIDWDMVPLPDVDRVEVVKGAGSSLYGSGAFGGVVHLITRDIPVGFHGRIRATAGDYANPPEAAWTFRDYTGGLGGLDATGSYGSAALRGSLTLGGRHSDGYREQDRSNQWETAGKAEWDPGPDTRLMASGSWTSHQYEVGPPWCEHGQCDDRGLAFQPFRTASPGAYTRSDKGYLAATLERTATAGFAWQARGSWLRSHFTDVKPDNWGVGNRFGAELRGTVRAADAHVGTIGVEATRSDVTSDIFGDHAEHAVAVYAEGEQGAGRARLTVGARADFRSLDGGTVSGVASPRLGAVWPTPLGTWRASVGRGFRAPSLAERFVAARAFGYRVIPNPGLLPETAWSYELGNAATLGARGRLDAAVFWTEARQLIEPAFIIDSGTPAIQLQNVARARLRGLDASLIATPFPWNLVTSASYTYLDTEDRATGTVLAFRPTHVATLGVDYAWRSLTVGGDFRYVSRIARIELAGSYAGDPRVAAKVLDLRAGWERGAWSARVLVTNALNYLYSLTPGTLEPVRTLSVVLGWTY